MTTTTILNKITPRLNSLNIVLTGKQNIELLPESLGSLPDDGLLVKTRLSMLSTGTECICYRGELEEGSHWAGWVKYPFYPGYSNVGVVEEVGSAVQDFQVGDRIFCTSHHQQYHIARPPARKIPDEVSDESAVWTKLATIAQTAVRRARLELGAKVAVIGLGPVGQLIVQYCRLMGAEEVLAIDLIESRLRVAAKHGATQTFTGAAAEALPFVREHTNGRLADFVFEVTGHPAVFPFSLKLTRNFGTMMLVGDCPQPGKQSLAVDIITRGVEVRGAHNEKLPPNEAEEWGKLRQTELFYKYIARGEMRTEDMITSRHSPYEAPEVYARLVKDRADSIGVAFDWSLL